MAENDKDKQPYTDDEEKILEGWKKVCDDLNKNGLKITLTPEEKKWVEEMLKWQKRSQDPKNFDFIIGCQLPKAA